MSSKTILITGASSGIGLACSKILSKKIIWYYVLDILIP